ncbi:MAG TPA: DinB family protein [Tepidisphaeraceae bacterium]|nr:DinB family protein [Tepidisphaeraceae bacterium]
MRIRILAIGAVLGMGSLAVAAQMGSAGKGMQPAVGTIATPSRAFDSQLSVIEWEMMGAVKAMPAEKFSFAPTTAIFVPGQQTEFQGVRTFAQQATHVAEANYFFYGIVSGLKPDVDVRAIEKLTKKEDVVAALAGSFQFAHKAIATLTAANAFEVVKSPEPGFQTRATLAAFGIAHANDHYGQIVEYLRMNGLIPPASAK